MTSTRRRLSLAISLAMSVYLVGTVVFIATIGPDVLRTGPSDTPLGVMALATLAVVAQLLTTYVWLRHDGLRRRYVVVVGFVEIAVGLLLFWQAPLLHGRFAPPGIQLLPHWAIGGLMGPAVTGLVMIVAAALHPGKERHLVARQ